MQKVSETEISNEQLKKEENKNFYKTLFKENLGKPTKHTIFRNTPCTITKRKQSSTIYRRFH